MHAASLQRGQALGGEGVFIIALNTIALTEYRNGLRGQARMTRLVAVCTLTLHGFLSLLLSPGSVSRQGLCA